MRLPDDSLTTALASGGRQHFGWGAERHMLADVYDAINLNTKFCAPWEKGKAPKFPEWPRPSTPKPAGEPKKPVSVRELYARMSRR